MQGDYQRAELRGFSDIVFNKVKTAGMAFGNGKVTRGFILFKVCSELMH